MCFVAPMAAVAAFVPLVAIIITGLFTMAPLLLSTICLLVVIALALVQFTATGPFAFITYPFIMFIVLEGHLDLLARMVPPI